MCRNKKIKRLRVLLPVLFILYFCNLSFFTHLHIINGVTIVHSHPYQTDSEGNPTHNHSTKEIQLIDALSTFYSVGAFVLSVTSLLFNLWQKDLSTPYFFHFYGASQASCLRLRAPPCFVN